MLFLKPRDGGMMRGPMDPAIRHHRAPLRELGIQIGQTGKSAPWEEIPFHVFDAGLSMVI